MGLKSNKDYRWETMIEYFDFNFKIKDNKPITKISLKIEFKKETAAMRKSGYPFSGVELGYYVHHIDDKQLAHNIWQFRKKLANKNYLIDFLFENNLITKQEYKTSEKWKTKTREKFIKNHAIAMSSEEVKKNMVASYDRELHSKIHKELWKNNREKYMKATQSPDVKRRRVGSFKKYLEDPNNKQRYDKAMRNPIRVEKISKAAKKMWENASNEKRNKMRSNWSKKLSYKGKKMNSIEFKIANMLDEKNIEWEYEPIIEFKNSFIQPDFIINGNIVMECFGDFWHANPEKYKDNHILYSTKTAKDQREFDKKRISLLEERFEHIVVLWENEINSSNIENILKERILCLL